ncbi:hypothetical protein [Lysobacter gummosus]|uniref:hypothetical protein n=1 Tax=Lysobacter gummosus TaxID=262324 RepID=UPI00363C0DAF
MGDHDQALLAQDGGSVGHRRLRGRGSGSVRGARGAQRQGGQRPAQARPGREMKVRHCGILPRRTGPESGGQAPPLQSAVTA